MRYRALKSMLPSAVLLAAIVPFAGCASTISAADNSAKDPSTIVIGAIPGEQSTTLDDVFSKVAQILEKDTGDKVQFFQSTSYASVIEAQRAGKVQIAAYGPFSYAIAHDSGAGAELIGYEASSATDSGAYKSALSVMAGSDIKTVADLKGKKVCFVDPASTSGYLYPTAALEQAGINPKTGITPVFAGTHPASVLALKSGQCDAAFSTQLTPSQLVQTGQLKKGETKEIWTSAWIPPSPLAISTKLSPALVAKIKNAFLTQMSVPALEKAGDCSQGASKDCGLPFFAVKTIADKTYDGIRHVCAITKAQACRNGG